MDSSNKDFTDYDGISIEDILGDVRRGYREVRDPELSKVIYLSGQNTGLLEIVARRLQIHETKVSFNGELVPTNAYRVNLDEVVRSLRLTKERAERRDSFA